MGHGGGRDLCRFLTPIRSLEGHQAGFVPLSRGRIIQRAVEGESDSLTSHCPAFSDFDSQLAHPRP